MYSSKQLVSKLTSIDTHTFEEVAFELFEFQYHNNSLYKNFCDRRKKNPKNCQSLFEIPHLPIDFFKKHEIKTGTWSSNKFFKSSGTTLQERSIHHVWSLDFYITISKENFYYFYLDNTIDQILAIVPSYQTNPNSSLLTMIDHLMLDKSSNSRYFKPSDYIEITDLLQNQPNTLIIGVTYALLDIAEKIVPFESNNIIMETGGMKGLRKEMIRQEVHQTLLKTFHTKSIHSEYGMTELFSQAYAKDKGIFYWPTWAKSWVRQLNDPLSQEKTGQTGGLNIIDLANWYSIAFIETQDLGRMNSLGGFEVLGRMDNSEVRGCNLLIY